jgi:hypothetical protein
MSIYRPSHDDIAVHMDHLSEEILREYAKVDLFANEFMFRGKKYTLDLGLSELSLKQLTKEKSSVMDIPHLQYEIGGKWGEHPDAEERDQALRKLRDFAKRYMEQKGITDQEERAKALDVLTRKAKLPPAVIYIILGVEDKVHNSVTYR